MLLSAVVLMLAAPAWAACVFQKEGRLREPPTWEALLACQEAQRAAFQKRDRRPAELEDFDESQRAEARGYMERHQSVVEGRGGEEAPSAEPASPAKTQAPVSEKDLSELKALLERESPGGVKGITPDAAKVIVKFLIEKQGNVSPEMSSLLQAVEKDGVRLSHATMLKVKDAARQAKKAGLELGIDKSVEFDLLDPAKDPKPGDPEPDYDRHGAKPSS